MTINVYETVSLKIETSTERMGKIDFTVTMPRNQFSDLCFLFANPHVGKVMRVKFLRELLNIGLRESLALVEAITELYKSDYGHFVDNPEIADFRNNHGQDD